MHSRSRRALSDTLRPRGRAAIGPFVDGVHDTHAAFLEKAQGDVRVFDLVGTTWPQVGADIDAPAAGYGHGWTVAMSGTSTRVVVGAPSHNNPNGRVYVWELVGASWTQVGATILAGNETGHDVDISDDGNRIAVGSPGSSGVQYEGRVTVYEWSGAAWVPLGAEILGTAPSAGAGTSVSLSADGNMVVIGSDGIDAGGSNTGEVRVMRWDAALSMWTQIGDVMNGPVGSGLGWSVSLAADGTRLMAGAPSGGGNARLYTRSGETWTRSPGPDFGSGARTGDAVAISADRRTSAVGAPYADAPGNMSGEVRIYDVP